jgi:hypothetical protein
MKNKGQQFPLARSFTKLKMFFRLILYSKFGTITGTEIFTAYRAKVPKKGKNFFMRSLFIKSVKTGPKRDENGFQSNGSCETAPVKSFHLTTAPHCPEVHAALEPFQAGNGQLLCFDLVPNCPPYSEY